MRKYVRDSQGRFAESSDWFAASPEEVADDIRVSVKTVGSSHPVWGSADESIKNMHPDDQAKVKDLLGGGPEARAKARADAKRQRARDRRQKAKDEAAAKAAEDRLYEDLDNKATLDLVPYKKHPSARIRARVSQIMMKRA